MLLATVVTLARADVTCYDQAARLNRYAKPGHYYLKCDNGQEGYAGKQSAKYFKVEVCSYNYNAKVVRSNCQKLQLDNPPGTATSHLLKSPEMNRWIIDQIEKKTGKKYKHKVNTLQAAFDKIDSLEVGFDDNFKHQDAYSTEEAYDAKEETSQEFNNKSHEITDAEKVKYTKKEKREFDKFFKDVTNSNKKKKGAVR